MLEVEEIQVSYEGVPALRGISFHIEEGKIISIIGSNGAGKSTILKTISGLLRPDQGTICFNGTKIDSLPPHDIAKLGISHIPEGRRLFSRLTVLQNLYLGAYVKENMNEKMEVLDGVFKMFPVLHERRLQRAGTLSGGEQQMLAIARGLMLRPKLLMLDEPSLGLAPMLVKRVFEIIQDIKKGGITVLLIEQNVHEALGVADYGYVIQTGKIVLHGTSDELVEKEMVRKAYLGL